MLWAAATAKPAGSENKAVVSRARVMRPLEWIQEFASRRMVTLPRYFPIAEKKSGPVLGFDASTTGGGAWLAPAREELPTHYATFLWTAEDEELLQAKRGDPGSQAVWETYALLLAIEAWDNVLARRFGTLELRGDAQGILQAVLKKRARSPVINVLVAEIQLCLAKSMHDIFGSHIWSEDNEWADQLSRLGEGAVMPPVFEKVNKTIVNDKHRWKFLTKLGVRAAVTGHAGEE